MLFQASRRRRRASRANDVDERLPRQKAAAGRTPSYASVARMSNANLQLAAKLQQAFQAAASNSTRWITCKVSDVTFDLAKSGPSSGALDRDLETLKAALDEDPCMILICVDEQSSPKKWVVVAYVTASCPVKKRMLFASGKTDFKRTLGQEFFKGEAHVENKSELTLEVVLRDKVNVDELPYSFEEMSMKEEHAQSARPSGKTEKGMANVEFPLTPELEKALEDFKSGAVDWIEVEVTKDEKIGVVKHALIQNNAASVQSRVDAQQPRFYLASRRGTSVGDRTYLVFCCPETSQIRLRMVYATCKASILEYGGLQFNKLLEIRSPDELDDLFVSEETVDEDAGKIKHVDMPKPKGPPGRAKR